MAFPDSQLRSHAIEDYAKAIYVLETRADEPVSTNALAERLDVTPGSVSAMLKFLAEVLDMPWDRVHKEAEVLEHVLSSELEEVIAEKLGNPTHDPHGDPIPSAEFVIDEHETRSLAELEPGVRGVFV